MRALHALVATMVVGLATLLFLHGQHPARAQVQLAETFVEHVRQQRSEAAQNLLSSGHLVGADYPHESFAVFAGRQLCADLEVVEVFPHQSRGNRLRRWLSGCEVEMPEIQVQFRGQCHMRIVLRRDTDGSWKIFNFFSHAA
jgi:hypothetical protein